MGEVVEVGVLPGMRGLHVGDDVVLEADVEVELLVGLLLLVLDEVLEVEDMLLTWRGCGRRDRSGCRAGSASGFGACAC